MALSMVLLAASLVASGNAEGQAEVSRTDPIVVTGNRLSPEEAQRVASQFVRAAGVGTDDRPVARWQEPVCISITGLQDQYAAILRRRLQQVAGAVGVRLASSGCAPNISVTFTNQSLDVLRQIRTRRPLLVRELTAADREALYRPGVPIRWLYATTVTTIDGREMTTAGQVGGPAVLRTTGGGGSSADSVVGPETPMTFGYGASSVSTGTARVLRGAAIIVDLGALDGQSMGALGDFIAMVAFAEMRAREQMPTGSILNLFTPTPPAGLTHQDRAFLSTLYRLPLDRRGRRHRAIMLRELVAAMTAAGTAQP